MRELTSVQDIYTGRREYPLLVTISFGDITRRGTSLATSAIKDDFLGLPWLVKAMLATESLSVQVQGTGKH